MEWAVFLYIHPSSVIAILTRMPELPHLLTVALNASPLVTYSIITFLALLEGPVLFVVCGFLLRLGALTLIPLVISLSIGDLVGDIFWYWIGRVTVQKTVRRKGKFMGITEKHLDDVEELFKKHSEWVLISSKATLGYGTSAGTLAVLMAAGVVKYPFVRFMVLNVIGEVFLLGIMLSIGYLFGTSYDSVSKDFKVVFLVGTVILIVVAAFFIGRAIKNRKK
jgi:membrane-associated protein